MTLLNTVKRDVITAEQSENDARTLLDAITLLMEILDYVMYMCI